jgi:hypothetical protein
MFIGKSIKQIDLFRPIVARRGYAFGLPLALLEAAKLAYHSIRHPFEVKSETNLRKIAAVRLNVKKFCQQLDHDLPGAIFTVPFVNPSSPYTAPDGSGVPAQQNFHDGISIVVPAGTHPLSYQTAERLILNVFGRLIIVAHLLSERLLFKR